MRRLFRTMTAVGLALAACAQVLAQTPAHVYSVTSDRGIWWLKDPAGQRMWSFGVCCVGEGSSWDAYDPANRSYAAFQQFKSPQLWAKDTFSKLKGWGFNTLGGWSDVDLIRKYGGKDRLPYFEVLHLGAYARAPFVDIFTDEARKAINDAAKTQIEKLRDDPLLVGYFTDNELGWWGDTLFTSYLAMPKSAPGKQHLLKVIHARYGNDFARLKAEWITPAKTFEEFEDKSEAKLRPGTDGIRLVKSWLSAMGTYYYSMVKDAVRAYDKDRLIMGDRYCQFYEMPIVEASKPYVDVVSTNFGASWNDGSIVRFFLDGLHQATDKPVIITEFYMGAFENRSGNKNVPPAFPVVQTQRERADAYAKNVRALASLPYVIGAHWFQFTDEPEKGRGDGENFNHGLMDIAGKPYVEMTEASKAARPADVHAKAVSASVAASAAPAPMAPMKGLKSWPRERSFVSSPDRLPFGDLYSCWDSGNLYLAVRWMEYMDEGLYEGDRIPEEERTTWTIQVAGMKSVLFVRYGGKGKKVWVSDAGVEVASEDGLQPVLMVKIPGRLIGRGAFDAGQSFDLSSGLTTHSRGQIMSWKTKVALTR